MFLVLGLVAFAFIVREPLASRQANFAPFITFYPAILLAALLDGVWAGILVTGLAALVADYWIFAPTGRFTIADPIEAISLAMFSIFGIALSVVIERSHQNREKLAAYQVEKAVLEERRKVDEERRMAESVKKERQRLLDVLEALPAMISLRRTDHRFAFANRSFRDKFGDPGDRRCFEARFGRTEPCEACEAYIPHQTGEPHHRQLIFPDDSRIEAYDFPFTDLDGTSLILEMGIDVTDRRRAERAVENYREHLEGLVAERTRQLEAANSRLEADMRELERTDSSLRESRAKLRAALSSMTDSVIITDAEGRFVDFNDAFASFYRFKSKADCAQNFAEFSSLIDVFLSNGERAPQDMYAMRRALRGETASNVEYILRRKDSGETWIGSLSFGPIRDDNGAITGTVITARDITAAKRSESRLRRFYETDLLAILYWKIDGGVVDVNDRFLQMSGYSREDLNAGLLNWSKMTPPEYMALDEDARRQVRETGVHLPYEKEFIRKDGTRVWGVFWAAAYEDDRGEGVSFILDISRRKLAEAELAEARTQAERSASQLRTIFDSVEERLYVCDQAGRPIMANNVSRQTYGQGDDAVAPSVEEMKSVMEVYDLQGRSLPVAEWPISRVLRGEHVQSAEIRVRFLATDQVRILSVNGSAIRDRDGNIGMAVLSSADITEKKRAEEQLKRLNRTLKARSESNQAVLHATGELEFLKEVCGIITNHCGHALVWVGAAEHNQEKTVRVVASAGAEDGYLAAQKSTWGDSKQGGGPTGKSIHSGQLSMCRNILTDDTFSGSLEEAVKRGYASVLAFPLKERGETWGALTIYSREVDAFSDAEVELLSELAGDLEFGISTLRMRAAHARAEEDLRKSEELLGLFVEHAPAALAMFDNSMRYLHVSRRWKIDYGLENRDLRGLCHYDVLPEIPGGWKVAHRRGLSGEVLSADADRFERMDGKEQWIRWEIRPWHDAEGKVGGIVIFSEDVTERKKTAAAILRSEKIALQREQFQALAERLRRVREEERTKVSRDLHDQIGQILTAIKMDLTWMSRRLPNVNHEFATRVKGTIALINEGVQSVRNICTGLRPGVLDDLGLAAAIEWQANEFATRTGIACGCSVTPAELALDEDRATEIFRIFQECLTNVIRHAQARSVSVSLGLQKDDLVLLVADDGKGFDESHVSRSLGFLGMKERAQVCDGSLQISSHPGRGTTIALRVPLHRAGSSENSNAYCDSR